MAVLQGCAIGLYCMTVLQGCATWLYCMAVLQGCTAYQHCKRWQGVVRDCDPRSIQLQCLHDKQCACVYVQRTCTHIGTWCWLSRPIQG
jgi:hypothetical protein